MRSTEEGRVPNAAAQAATGTAALGKERRQLAALTNDIPAVEDNGEEGSPRDERRMTGGPVRASNGALQIVCFITNMGMQLMYSC